MSSSTIRILDVPQIASEPLTLPANTPENVGNIFQRLTAAARKAIASLKNQRDPKTLRLCETISLGEKRFLAIVQVNEERILIGGSATTVALLTRLPEKQSFATVLLERSQSTHPA